MATSVLVVETGFTIIFHWMAHISITLLDWTIQLPVDKQMLNLFLSMLWIRYKYLSHRLMFAKADSQVQVLILLQKAEQTLSQQQSILIIEMNPLLGIQLLEMMWLPIRNYPLIKQVFQLAVQLSKIKSFSLQIMKGNVVQILHQILSLMMTAM